MSSKLQRRAKPAPSRSRSTGKPSMKSIPKNRLQQLRERHKPKGFWLTQGEVAKVLGIAEATVSRHESGERGLSHDDVEAYAKLYKVQTHEIFANLTIDSNTRR